MAYENRRLLSLVFLFFETVFNANGYLQEFWVDIKPYLYTHAKSTHFYQEHRIECYTIKNSKLVIFFSPLAIITINSKGKE